MTQYELQHSPDGITWSDSITVENTEQFTLTGLPYDAPHSVRMRSVNPVSKEVSGWTVIVSATPHRPVYAPPRALVPLEPDVVSFVTDTSTVPEGLPHTVILSRSGDALSALSVLVQEIDGTGGGDYTLEWPGEDAGIVFFEAGQYQASLVVNALSDPTAEPADTVTFTILPPPTPHYEVGLQNDHVVTLADADGLTYAGELWHDASPVAAGTPPEGVHPIVYAMDVAKATWEGARPTEHDVIHVYVGAGTSIPIHLGAADTPTHPGVEHYTPWWGEGTLVLHGEGPSSTIVAPMSMHTRGWVIDEPTTQCSMRLAFVGFQFQGTQQGTFHLGHASAYHSTPLQYIRFVSCHFVDSPDRKSTYGPDTITGYKACVGVIRCHVNMPLQIGGFVTSHNPVGHSGLESCDIIAIGESVWMEDGLASYGVPFQPHETTILDTKVTGYSRHQTYPVAAVEQVGSTRIMRVDGCTFTDISREDKDYTGTSKSTGPALHTYDLVNGTTFLGSGNMGTVVEDCVFAIHHTDPASISPTTLGVYRGRALRIQDCAISGTAPVVADAVNFSGSGINTPPQLADLYAMVTSFRADWEHTPEWNLGTEQKPWGPLTKDASSQNGIIQNGPRDLTAPLPPTITGTTAQRGRVVLDWNKGDPCAGYRVWWRKTGTQWRGENTEMIWTNELRMIETPPQYGPTYSMEFRRANWSFDFTATEYEFRIDAFSDLLVHSVPSNVVAETPLEPYQPPTSLTAVDVLDTTATITFTESPTITNSAYMLTLRKGTETIGTHVIMQGTAECDLTNLASGGVYTVTLYHWDTITGYRSKESAPLTFTTVSQVAEPTGFQWYSREDTLEYATAAWAFDGKAVEILWGDTVVQVDGRNVVQFADGRPAVREYRTPGVHNGTTIWLHATAPHEPGERYYAQIRSLDLGKVSAFTNEVRWVELPDKQGVYPD